MKPSKLVSCIDLVVEIKTIAFRRVGILTSCILVFFKIELAIKIAIVLLNPCQLYYLNFKNAPSQV